MKTLSFVELNADQSSKIIKLIVTGLVLCLVTTGVSGVTFGGKIYQDTPDDARENLRHPFTTLGTEVVLVEAGYTTDTAIFRIELALGTFDPSDYLFTIYLDTDLEPNDPAPGAIPDGTDFWVSYSPGQGLVNPSIIDWDHGEGGVVVGGTVTPISPTEVLLLIPLNLLGNAEGPMRFGLRFGKSTGPQNPDDPFPPSVGYFFQDEVPNGIFDGFPAGSLAGPDEENPIEPTIAVTAEFSQPDAVVYTEAVGLSVATDSTETELPTDPSVSPHAIIDPDVNDLARSKVEYLDMDERVFVDAKASLGIGLGGTTEVVFPSSSSGLGQLEAISVAGHVRFFKVSASEFTLDPLADIDLVLAMNGLLALADLRVPGISSLPGSQNLWAQVTLEAFVYLPGQQGQNVFTASSRLFPASPGGDIMLQSTGSDLWMDAWTTEDSDPAPEIENRVLNFFEVFPDLFPVPLEATYGVELRLTCQSYGDSDAVQWSALTDFLNTASYNLETDTPGVEIVEIVPDPTFIVTDLVLRENRLNLTWESFPGNAYTILGTDDLTAEWTELKTGVEAAPSPNNRTTYSLDRTDSTLIKRFYRIIEESSSQDGP